MKNFGVLVFAVFIATFSIGSCVPDVNPVVFGGAEAYEELLLREFVSEEWRLLRSTTIEETFPNKVNQLKYRILLFQSDEKLIYCHYRLLII